MAIFLEIKWSCFYKERKKEKQIATVLLQFDLEMSFSQPEELNHIFFLSFFLEIVN